MADDRTKEMVEQKVATLFKMDTQEKLEHYYDDVAETYDQDMLVFEYVAPIVGVNVLQKFVSSKSAHILDVACGTGLVGEKLQDVGYTNVDGLDGSTTSIEVARKKNIYTNLYVEWLGGDDNRLSIGDDTYDVIMCVGGFAINHLKSDCFKELIRVVKPGGYIIITMRMKWIDIEPSYSDGKLEADMKKLETEGKWKVIEKEIYKAEDNAQDTITFVFQIC